MSIDLKMELAKQEYVKAINEINDKYEIPISIVEILLAAILNEVSIMKNNKIAQEMEEQVKKQDENNEEKEEKSENK